MFQELGDLGLLPILKIEKPRLKVKQLPKGHNSLPICSFFCTELRPQVSRSVG